MTTHKNPKQRLSTTRKSTVPLPTDKTTTVKSSFRNRITKLFSGSGDTLSLIAAAITLIATIIVFYTSSMTTRYQQETADFKYINQLINLQMELMITLTK